MKIAIMGSDTAAKSSVIIALSKEIDIVDLPLRRTSISCATKIKLVIYVTNSKLNQYEIDQLDRLRGTYESMILVSQVSDPSLREGDLFIPIAPFNSFNAELIMKEIFSIRKFIYSLNPSIPPLTNIQLQVLEKYYMGFSKEEASSSLRISPRTYQNILADVRILFGVLKNRELIRLVSIPTLLKAG
jgi:hypothetical protein